MPELNEMKLQLQTAVDSIAAYGEKQTKTASAAIRKQLGEIKKNVTAVRAAMVAADKK